MTLYPSHSFLLATVLFALAGCRSPRGQTTPQWPPMGAGELGSMQTVSFAEGLWFGSEPRVEDVELAQRRGVAMVIDLCMTGRSDVAEASADLELSWTHVTILVDGEFDDAAVDRVLSLLAREPAPGTLMYCEDGRVSATLFAIHRIVHCSVPVEQALNEARRAGMRLDPGEARVRSQVGRLRGTPPAQ